MASNNTLHMLNETVEIGTLLGSVQTNLDDFFVIVISMIVFFMQAGFAFLEAGAVRSKNTTNILLKNMLDSSVAGLSYWALGYAFAYGKGGRFIGSSGFFGTFPTSETSKWFFQMVFAATAATIVSGGVAERCEFIAYFAYSIVLTAFCYPVITRWGWHDNSHFSPNDVGWLIDGVSVIPGAKYQDFGGSGMVHLCGGVAALFGAVLLGPRLGRFDDQGKSQSIPGHSVPMTALGGFILMFGFFAFSGGSQFGISQPGDGKYVAIAMVNTMIAGNAAGVTTIILHRVIVSASRNCFFHSTWSLLTTINGVLAGMVSICAGANVMASWGAFVTGVIAALLYYAVSALMVALKVDDPLDAVAVHGAGGTWGLIAAPLFDAANGFLVTGSQQALKVLAMNLIGWSAIVAWTSAICGPMFIILRITNFFRVSPEIEVKGLDIPKHAEPAYPAEAWGDGWGNFLHISSDGLAIIRKSIIEKSETPAIDTRLTDLELRATKDDQLAADNHAVNIE